VRERDEWGKLRGRGRGDGNNGEVKGVRRKRVRKL